MPRRPCRALVVVVAMLIFAAAVGPSPADAFNFGALVKVGKPLFGGAKKLTKSASKGFGKLAGRANSAARSASRSAASSSLVSSLESAKRSAGRGIRRATRGARRHGKSLRAKSAHLASRARSIAARGARHASVTGKRFAKGTGNFLADAGAGFVSGEADPTSLAHTIGAVGRTALELRQQQQADPYYADALGQRYADGSDPDSSYEDQLVDGEDGDGYDEQRADEYERGDVDGTGYASTENLMGRKSGLQSLVDGIGAGALGMPHRVDGDSTYELGGVLGRAVSDAGRRFLHRRGEDHQASQHKLPPPPPYTSGEGGEEQEHEQDKESPPPPPYSHDGVVSVDDVD